MSARVHQSITSLAAVVALLALLLVPLCGGVAAAHLCPMEMSAMSGHGDSGCQGPSGPGIKRQTMDCCVAPQSGSPPVRVVAPVQVVIPVLAQPMIEPTAQLEAAKIDLPLALAPPGPSLLRLHSSLLL